MSDQARSTSERAIRKASARRLLAEMRWAVWVLSLYGDDRELYLKRCAWENSRTRYACLMTAFGR